jgi:hypothetical protein
MNENVDDEKLDDAWLIEFENTDKLYEEFYKDDLCYVNLVFVYINRENNIEKIKEETFLMSTPNYISKEELVEILKKNMTDNNIHYSLLSMLKYNITIDPVEIQHDKRESSFLSVVKNIDTIFFEKTIHMFQDMNDLIFLFYEKSVTDFKKGNHDRLTRKIMRAFSKRKTTRRQYSAN